MILPYKSGVSVRVASPYGARTDPITGEADVWHTGIDLIGVGDKTICAVCGGTVIRSRMVTDRANRTWEWGNYVSVAGDDGLTYIYCHLSGRIAVAGDRVEAGQEIGIEGSTGRSTGSHLHFEVRNAVGANLDPAELLGIPNIPGTVAYINQESAEKEEETMNDEKKQDANDSEPSEWAKEAVEWAVENGIIYGTGDGELKLRDPCTREQMMVFLHRFAQLIGKA